MIAMVLFWMAITVFVLIFLASINMQNSEQHGIENISEKALKFDALLFFAAAVAKFIFTQ